MYNKYMNAAAHSTHTHTQLFKLLLLLPVILSLSLLSPVYVYIKYACIFFLACCCCYCVCDRVTSVATSFILIFIILDGWSFGPNFVVVPIGYVTSFLSYVSHEYVCVWYICPVPTIVLYVCVYEYVVFFLFSRFNFCVVESLIY